MRVEYAVDESKERSADPDDKNEYDHSFSMASNSRKSAQQSAHCTTLHRGATLEPAVTAVVTLQIEILQDGAPERAHGKSRARA